MRGVGRRGLMTRLLGGCLACGVVAGVVVGMDRPDGKEPQGASLSGDGAAVVEAASRSQIVCPDVTGRLPAIPASAQAEVKRNLGLLETQIAEANQRLVTTVGQGGPNFVQNAILGPLKSKRVATIDRIAIAIGRTAPRPTGLESLATCSLQGGGQAGNGAGNNGGQAGNGAGNNGGQGGNAGAGDAGNAGGTGQGVVGPLAEDFVDIRRVRPTRQPRATGRASRGTFVSRCGNNENKHQNTDNIIISPGVTDGAEHLHDYVGNLSTDFRSTDQSLAAAGTTCQNKADKTTYFWPVLRVRKATDGPGAAVRGQNNVGTPVLPVRTILQFRGNPTSKVTPMPQFLRLFSGDAKTVSKVSANARPTWTCTGFTNRVSDKYTLCPAGSNLVRVFDLPSCWDGKNTDSANHRTHVVFPQGDGRCPAGTRAVPQLRMMLVYNGVPNTPPNAGQVPFAVDGFSTERHKPDTDHAGAVNVMSPRLAAAVAQCINTGRRC